MYPSTLEWTLVKTQYGALIEFLDELGVMDFTMQKLRLKNFYYINKVHVFFFISWCSLQISAGFTSFPQFSQFSSRNKGFLFISPTGKPPIRAVPPIFRTSTCLWDNRNRFVSKKIMKNYMKWFWLLRKNLVSAEVVYAGWLAGGNWNCCQWVSD